jgi:penicillin-binding protein 2
MLSRRSLFISILPILLGIVYTTKLAYIQIFSYKYGHTADANIVKPITDLPYRGLIKDCHGIDLVQNIPVYDLMACPKDLKNLNINAFCTDFGISYSDFKKNFDKAKKYSYVHPSFIVKGISHQRWASMQEHIYKYPFVFVNVRLIRQYPIQALANTFGYIAEINSTQLGSKIYDDYTMGDLVGVSGLEKIYEKELGGIRGIRYKIVNAMGIEQGSFAGGKEDLASVPGKSITTTIDRELQIYGELLMQNKTGCIVAIEPKTGGILAIVSSPSYDPNMLTGDSLSKNFSILTNDTNKPLFNRPIMATYPPGSIFKLVQALISLQLKVADTGTSFPCDKSFINCHTHPSNINMRGAIQHSCNPYFGYLFRRIINRKIGKTKFEDTSIGLEEWSRLVKSFGFGSTLGIDLPEEKAGFVPNKEFYDKMHGCGAWKASTIRSLDIGQGELLITPLQMANLAAIIANRGHYYRPHLVKRIDTNMIVLSKNEKYSTDIDTKHFDFFVSAMQEAVEAGTARRCYIPNIVVCAKTGTVQNPHGEDHSVCIAFAPQDSPQIAIAVYVENAGWGPRAGAAIAGLMIEMYINRSIKRTHIQDYVLKGDFH